MSLAFAASLWRLSISQDPVIFRSQFQTIRLLIRRERRSYKGLLERLEASDLIMLIKREAGEPAGTTRIGAETMMASQLINCLFKAVAVDEFGGSRKLRVVTSSGSPNSSGSSNATLQIV